MKAKEGGSEKGREADRAGHSCGEGRRLGREATQKEGERESHIERVRKRRPLGGRLEREREREKESATEQVIHALYCTLALCPENCIEPRSAMFPYCIWTKPANKDTSQTTRETALSQSGV